MITQQYQGQIPCLIIKLSEAIYLILGDDWLLKHKAHVDLETKASILQSGKKKYHVIH